MRDPKSSPSRWMMLVVVLSVAFTFARALRYDFIWDDDIHVTQNPLLQSFSMGSLERIWTEPYRGLFIPVTYTIWGLISDVATIAGPNNERLLNPDIFHLANLLVHAINSLLVLQILHTMVKNGPAAMLGALVFAVHPLQVEPVVWISGLRDLLAGTFSLALILLYLRSDRNRWRTIAILGVLYVLALLSKPSAAPVILVAWLCGLWIDSASFGTARRRLMLMLPLLAIAVAITIFQGRLQSSSAALGWNPPWFRPAVAIDAVSWYTQKLFLPLGLCLDQGRTPYHVRTHPLLWSGWIVPIGALLTSLLFRKRFPILLLSVMMFVLLLSPVLGLVPFTFQYFSTVADRYAYLAMLAAAVLVSALLAVQPRKIAFGFMGIAVVMLIVASLRQAGMWRDEATLYHHSLSINPDSSLVLGNLGALLAREDRFDEALPPLKRAAELAPDDPVVLRNYAAILRLKGDLEGEKRELQAAQEAERRLKQHN